jgi:hypothetical protein
MIVASCQKNGNVSPSASVNLSEKYLEFKDFLDFHEKLKSLEKQSRIELDAWNTQMNFTSLRSIYERIIDISTTCI